MLRPTGRAARRASSVRKQMQTSLMRCSASGAAMRRCVCGWLGGPADYGASKPGGVTCLPARQLTSHSCSSRMHCNTVTHTLVLDVICIQLLAALHCFDLYPLYALLLLADQHGRQL